MIVKIVDTESVIIPAHTLSCQFQAKNGWSEGKGVDIPVNTVGIESHRNMNQVYEALFDESTNCEHPNMPNAYHRRQKERE